YYIAQVKRRLEVRKRSGIGYWGLDVSRDAVRMAAKRYKGITFFIADVWKGVLFEDSSISVLLDIFAPRNASEFARVLKQNGLMLIVIPGPGHLEELRTDLKLLGIEADKREQVVKQFSPAFRLTRQQPLNYDMLLAGDELHDLVTMTPNYRHISKEKLEGLKERSMRVKADFDILEFVKV
ncbi:MAG: hypothetical protein PHR27_10850, partial [Candidatus Cloacimonetes bacterium]|nr:hypothetical protein [Candidatus Cloacimonadota bacterium]